MLAEPHKMFAAISQTQTSQVFTKVELEQVSQHGFMAPGTLFLPPAAREKA